MKNSMQHLLRSKGASKKVLFPLFLGGRGPSKKHARFLEGAAWKFSWLTPFCLCLIFLTLKLCRGSGRIFLADFAVNFASGSACLVPDKSERWHKLIATLRRSQGLEGACFHGGFSGGFFGGYPATCNQNGQETHCNGHHSNRHGTGNTAVAEIITELIRFGPEVCICNGK